DVLGGIGSAKRSTPGDERFARAQAAVVHEIGWTLGQVRRRGEASFGEISRFSPLCAVVARPSKTLQTLETALHAAEIPTVQEEPSAQAELQAPVSDRGLR
ncbi:hypothetical protein KFL_001390010, partial [Klebsormidium nitens]